VITDDYVLPRVIADLDPDDQAVLEQIARVLRRVRDSNRTIEIKHIRGKRIWSVAVIHRELFDIPTVR